MNFLVDAFYCTSLWNGAQKFHWKITLFVRNRSKYHAVHKTLPNQKAHIYYFAKISLRWKK